MARLIKISKKWGDRSIFDDFSLDIADNKTTVLMGASGVGKTTLLNIVAGTVEFEGEVEGFGKLSYVFQEHRLIPFLTVRQNLEYVLCGAIKDKNAVNEVIDGVLGKMKLTGYGERIADTLSGGEKQRVAIARALCYPSKTLLADEPFNSLDVKLKSDVVTEFSDLVGQYRKTCLFVTHNVDEALFLADEIICLYEGGSVSRLTVSEKERRFGFEKDPEPRKKLYGMLCGE